MTANTLINKQRTVRVLLVEDNKGDVLLTKRAFEGGGIASELMVANTGEEALAILKKEPTYMHYATPDLILLDLNLPQMNGLEILKKIKEDNALKYIPVIILSSSCADQDVLNSYNFHANSYIMKPANLESFNDLVQKLEQFWFNLVVLPD